MLILVNVVRRHSVDLYPKQLAKEEVSGAGVEHVGPKDSEGPTTT